MLKVNFFYYLVGFIMSIIGVMTLLDKTNPKRLTSGVFWCLYGVIFSLGNILPAYIIGFAVIIMCLLAGFAKVTPSRYIDVLAAQKQQQALRLGNKLFIPAITIPSFIIIGTLVFKNLTIDNQLLIEAKNLTIICVALGCILATIFACIISRESPNQAMHEMRRLVDTMGWAIILPQMLAMLGLIFSATGVDKALGLFINNYVNMNWLIVVVTVYVFGSALLTIVMGNAFVAFPIMMGAVGIPSLIVHFAMSPALIAAIGMLSGYCGTLMTPMAANFNIIPAALLELKDRNRVIKVQTPSALLILCANFIFLLIMSKV